MAIIATPAAAFATSRPVTASATATDPTIPTTIANSTNGRPPASPSQNPIPETSRARAGARTALWRGGAMPAYLRYDVRSSLAYPFSTCFRYFDDHVRAG